jgi:hypothetical protein
MKALDIHHLNHTLTKRGSKLGYLLVRAAVEALKIARY